MTCAPRSAATRHPGSAAKAASTHGSSSPRPRPSSWSSEPRHTSRSSSARRRAPTGPSAARSGRFARSSDPRRTVPPSRAVSGWIAAGDDRKNSGRAFRIPGRHRVRRRQTQCSVALVKSEGGSVPVGFDTNAKFVRIVNRRADGFVEFEFAIGEPEIFVEMIMSPAAFVEFCSANAVTMLDPRLDTDEIDDWAWNLHDAATRRFRDHGTDTHR
ncbi:MAG: phenol hydroxylase subunit [Ilumatobacteraceae bacterium]